jgi:hypothetical protein
VEGCPGNQGRRRGKFAACAGVRAARQPARVGLTIKMTFSQPQCHEPTGTVRISILLTSYFEFQLYQNDIALHTRLVSFSRLQHRPRQSCDRCCGSCSFVHSLSMASRSPNRPGLREVVSRHAHPTTRDDISLTMLKLNFLPEALPTFSNSPMHSCLPHTLPLGL